MKFLRAWPFLLLLLSGMHLLAAKRPNVVFILADDLSYSDLGCFSSKEIKTPNLDRLAICATSLYMNWPAKHMAMVACMDDTIDQVRWPRTIPAGTVTGDFLTSLELFPSILSATKTNPPRSKKTQ